MCPLTDVRNLSNLETSKDPSDKTIHDLHLQQLFKMPNYKETLAY